MIYLKDNISITSEMKVEIMRQKGTQEKVNCASTLKPTEVSSKNQIVSVFKLKMIFR